MSHGFPYDVVETWSVEERHAQLIVAGELNGGKWDWDRMTWREPDR